jgi:hypothetical protein
MKSNLIFFTILFFTLSCFAQQTKETKNKSNNNEVLVISFFRGNGEMGTYMAWSEDGIHFKALKNNQPIFSPPQWKDDQNLTRDPSVLYHNGYFHLVWTCGNGGNGFGYAKSKDLIHWSEPIRVEPFPKSLNKIDQPNTVWAPEICWDPVQKNYMIVWATITERESNNKDRGVTGKEGNSGNCLYISRTNDGKNFTPAKEFFKPKFSCIDGQLNFLPHVKSKPFKGQWLMVVKDEREIELGGKNIRITYAPADFSQPWTPVSEPIVGAGSPVQTKEMAEGPCLVQWQGKWLLYWDAFGNGHYSLAISDDMKSWKDMTSELVMPNPRPQHGTIFKAPRSIIKLLE